MESNNDYAFNRLKILANDNSFDKNTGSLIVNGGIGCKKTISSDAIITNCLHVKNDIGVDKNLCVDETITFNNIEPKTSSSNIGKIDKKVNKIYTNNVDSNDVYVNNSLISTNIKSNNLDVANSSKLGKDCNGNIILNIDKSNRYVKFNNEKLSVCDNNIKILDVSKSNILLNSLLRVSYQKECIKINCNNYNLYPNSSYIIINSSNCKNITIMEKKNVFCCSNILDGTLIKIYNKTNLTLKINNNILPPNSNIEFIYMINKWECLNNYICNSSNNDNMSSVFSINDSNY